MKYVYVDESGSMTSNYCDSNHFFVISMVIVDKDKLNHLKRVYARYISKTLTTLKAFDLANGKMFNNDSFIELKSNQLSIGYKHNFSNYLCQNNLFKIIMIKIDNTKVQPKLYDNTARAFNYIINIALEHAFKVGILSNDDYFFQIDQRNTKNDAIKMLEDYLYLDHVIKNEYMESVQVQYFESHRNNMIQLADFFANLYFSYLNSIDNYSSLIKSMRSKGYIIKEFVFPIS